MGWIRLTVLERRLERQGYRRLQELQVNEAQERSKRVLRDLSDAVAVLQTVAEKVEGAITDMSGDWDDDDRRTMGRP